MTNESMATPVIELGPAPIFVPDPSPVADVPVAIVATPQTGVAPVSDQWLPAALGIIVLLILASYFWRSAR